MRHNMEMIHSKLMRYYGYLALTKECKVGYLMLRQQASIDDSDKASHAE